MKLIYLANIRLPTEKAHGLQIMEMCQSFAREGVNVELVVTNRKTITREPFEYYNVAKVFRITRLLSLDLTKFGWLGFLIQSATFFLAAHVYLLFKRYEILYTRDLIAGRFFKKFTYEAHALPEGSKKIFRKALKILVLTDCIKKELVCNGISEERILVLPDAVDIEKFKVKSQKSKVRQELNLPLNKKLVGYVGMFKTMGMEKGVGVLLEALQHLDKDTALVLVGGSPEDMEHYRKKAKELGVAERAIFTGRVMPSSIPDHLRSFDVAVAPYPRRKHYECYMSPLKIFEYMAAGVPIVASDLSSLREVLNKNNAVLVEPENGAALARGVRLILQNPEFGRKLAEKALKDVQNHTWQKRAQRALLFIKSVL